MGSDWRRAITPSLFTFGTAVSVTGIVIVLGRHGWSARPVAAVLVVLYLLWVLSEAPVSLGRPSTPPREVSTLICYGLSRFATVAAAEFLLPVAGGTTAREVLAFALFAGGVTLRTVAIRTLGRFYSHHVIKHDGHAIVSTGPYTFIRHPAYAGMLLANVGLVVFFLNWYSVALLAVLAAVLSWRIRVEEKTLGELPAYQVYASQHSRLVPGIW